VGFDLKIVNFGFENENAVNIVGNARGPKEAGEVKVENQ
jgi:hypothetical protein